MPYDEWKEGQNDSTGDGDREEKTSHERKKKICKNFVSFLHEEAFMKLSLWL